MSYMGLTAPLMNQIREFVTKLVYEVLADSQSSNAIHSTSGARVNPSLLRSTHSIGTKKRSAQNIIDSNSPSGSVYSNPIVTLAPKSYNNRNTVYSMKNKIIFGSPMNTRQFANKGDKKMI